MEKSKKRDLSNIEYSLSRGKFDGSSRKANIIGYVVLVSICIAGLIIAITMFSVEYANGNTPVGQFVLELVGISLIVSLLISGLTVYLRRNEKLRKEILLWLEDAVEVKAHCKCVDIDYEYIDGIPFPLHKIQVEFKLNGTHYVRKPKDEHRGKFEVRRKGYFRGLSKYVNKEIKILYSQKYNEVLILKS